jgi:radical SAM protein (TIGR01212 family)
MEIGWNGLPYNPISNFYRQKFGAKIYKIPVTVVDSCPNRKGFKGMQTCVFCDVWGSAANAESSVMNLSDQITRYQEIIRKKYKAEKFLVYFQAYTNTFTKISQLRENFETALEFPDVVGFVVGTRPDCLSQGVLDLWQEYHQKTFVAVELGVQSFFDDQLEFMRRGHSSLDSWKALLKISSTTSVDLGVHLMFGQPGETDADILLTAKLVNSLPIRNVKLHNLHVLRETPLEGLFQNGQFLPIERELYAQRVQLFLENIRPDIFVQRLAAYSSRWNELVAPAWTADKMGTHQFLIDFLRERQSYQSKSLT